MKKFLILAMLFSVAAVFAAVEIIPLIVLTILISQPLDASSVGIIGGADGPTSVFVAAPNWAGLAIGTAVFAVLLTVGIVLLKKAKQ